MNNKSAIYTFLGFSSSVAIFCAAFLIASISGVSAAEVGDTFKIDTTFLFKVVYIMFACCVAALAVFTFLFKKKLSKTIKLSSPKNIAADSVGFAVCLALAVYGVICQITAQRGGDFSNTLLTAPNARDGLYLPNVFFIAALFASAVYLLLFVLNKLGKDGNLPAGLSLFPVAAIGLKLVCDFLVQNTNGYSKLYNYHIVALCCLLLFALNETRIFLHCFTPPLYMFFGAVGAMASVIYAVPTLWLNHKGVMELSTKAEVVYCVVDLLLAAIVYIRLLSLGVRATDVAPETQEPRVIFDEYKE